MIECDPAAVPRLPGAYILELHLERSIVVTVGRLGTFPLGPGRLRYYGSARGPGGLRARIGRHRRRLSRRDRWHIDALTRVSTVTGIWIDLDASECDLVRHDLETGGWRCAVAGFGSSDCSTCAAHLLKEAQ
jgi:Uri superfamily endonuclease